MLSEHAERTTERERGGGGAREEKSQWDKIRERFQEFYHQAKQKKKRERKKRGMGKKREKKKKNEYFSPEVRNVSGRFRRAASPRGGYTRERYSRSQVIARIGLLVRGTSENFERLSIRRLEISSASIDLGRVRGP